MIDTSKAKLASEPLSEDANKVLTLVEETPVTTHDDLRTVTTWVAEIKTKHQEVDEIRKSFTDPLRKVVEDINAFFKPALEALKDAEAGIKKKISDYTTGQLEQRDKLLATLDIDATNGEKATVIEKADKLKPPKIPGLSTRETWDGTVTDQDLVIRWAIETNRHDLLLVNEKGLKALTKSLGRDPKIPGWKAEVKRTVVVTPSKV
jgi:hypothetical protein